MGKTVADAVAEARDAVAKVVARTMRTAMIAIGERPEEEIAAAACMSQGEAPMYLHMVKTLSASVVRSEQANTSPVTNNLALFMVERAKNPEEWAKMAAPFARKAIAAKPEAIDVPVVAKEPAVKR